MAKRNKVISNVESWYPSAQDILRTQRAQMEESKRAAAEFASQTFGKETKSWWRRWLRLS